MQEKWNRTKLRHSDKLQGRSSLQNTQRKLHQSFVMVTVFDEEGATSHKVLARRDQPMMSAEFFRPTTTDPSPDSLHVYKQHLNVPPQLPPSQHLNTRDMAKSQRASTRKRNNAKLRSTVFSPHYDARTERISAKLQEIAARPKPEREQEMEVDREEEEVQAARSSDGLEYLWSNKCKIS